MDWQVFIDIAFFLFGAAGLIWAADRFVYGASIVSLKTGISHFLIGLTIVAIGTSFPEIFISISSAINEIPLLAIGDAIGSNIANIGLIAGCAVTYKPEVLEKPVSPKSVILLLAITIFSIFIFINNYLTIIDGYILLLLAIAIVVVKIYWYKNHPNETEIYVKKSASLKLGIFWIIAGIILLPLSSQLTVIGASGIAKYVGISDFIIGLFLVAIGTSLPELATTMVSLRQNKKHLAFGNIIGSNIFNLTIVLAPVGIISPTKLPARFLSWDMSYLLGLTILFAIIISLKFNLKYKNLLRVNGIFLLIGYLVYLIYSIK